MNCSLAVEQEPLLNEKDAKITSLQRSLTITESHSTDVLARESYQYLTREEALLVSPTSGPRFRSRSSHVPVADAKPRRGKAPPVDVFSGESAEFQFEDFLPSLE